LKALTLINNPKNHVDFRRTIESLKSSFTFVDCSILVYHEQQLLQQQEHVAIKFLSTWHIAHSK
jgi:hypothetical protein